MQLAAHVECLRCRFDLFGCDANASCPDCNFKVRASLWPDRLVFWTQTQLAKLIAAAWTAIGWIASFYLSAVIPIGYAANLHLQFAAGAVFTLAVSLAYGARRRWMAAGVCAAGGCAVLAGSAAGMALLPDARGISVTITMIGPASAVGYLMIHWHAFALLRDHLWTWAMTAPFAALALFLGSTYLGNQMPVSNAGGYVMLGSVACSALTALAVIMLVWRELSAHRRMKRPSFCIHVKPLPRQPA